MSSVTTIVSVKWLSEKLATKPKDFRLLDASWHLPTTGRVARNEYKEKHIPDALFYDLEECRDKSSSYGHMLPSPAEFENYVSNLGISNNTHVVVYDNSEKVGLFSAPRVWWTFRTFGHNKISILDGGLPKWCSEGHPATSQIPKVQPEKFTANFHPECVKTFEDVEANLSSQAFQLVDARPPGRFEGKDPEPRPDVKPGHIPGSLNLPIMNIMNSDTKTVKTPEELQKMFSLAGIDFSKPVTCSCGAGVAACCIILAAHLCGKDDVPLFDGSWAEWYFKSKPSQKVNCPED